MPAAQGGPTLTAKELRQIRTQLEREVVDLHRDIDNAMIAIDRSREGGQGSGDDQADAGSVIFEREHEMSLANNSRELLDQVERALERLEAGTYGICESCGNPIGTKRLLAMPKVTLCIVCKAREERR